MTNNTYALSTWLFLKESLESVLKKFAGAGFNTVEIWADQIHLDPRNNPDLESITKIVTENNLSIHSVHAPFHGLFVGSVDETELRETEHWILASIHYASKLKAKIVVVHPLTIDLKKVDQTSLAATQQLISRLVDEAEKVGVTIAIENLPFAPPIYTSMQSLVELFPDQRIGFCLDIGHSYLNHFDILNEIKVSGSRLVSSHISNNDGKSDLHSLPGNGKIDMDQVLETLRTKTDLVPVFEVNGEVNGQVDSEKILNDLQLFRDTH
jgi:sugar phosphate isomerase/epimerase